MQPVILNRLISARFLLENSGLSLNRNSDSRAVAQNVLMAHDAAELALTAIADHLKIALPERTEFPKLIDQLNSHVGMPGGLSGHVYLTKLNKVRIAFKHHGLLPDSGSWFDVVDRTSLHLDETCLTAVGVALSKIDLTHLIEDQKVQQLIAIARTKHEQGFYKEALEVLAKALYRSNLLFPRGLEIIPGNSDPQQALILSGYGVDPSAFIVLQQLLPSVSGHAIVWKLHETGHEANWGDENVAFAIHSTVTLILQLQHGSARPQPQKFRDAYTDVLTIKCPNPHVHMIYRIVAPGGFGFVNTTAPLNDFSVGDKIRGMVHESYDSVGETIDEENWNPDDAVWLKVDGPSSDKREFNALFDSLIVKREHVDVSYEEVLFARQIESTDDGEELWSQFLENLYDIP